MKMQNKDQESGTTIQWYADGEAIEGATNKQLYHHRSRTRKNSITVKSNTKERKRNRHTVTSEPQKKSTPYQ